jgi:HKD family nuclease
MLITPLSQGITTDITNSTGEALIRFFNDTEYHTFTGMSAFASVAGINGLAPHIEAAKQRGQTINFIVGVDQKATSKEALEAMASLGINSFIFHQLGGSIFHPKVYLFEGEHKSQLIVGSSNLTRQGLYVNVEASLLLELSHDVPEDFKVITDMKASFSSLYDFSDPNLSPITAELIKRLVIEKVVPTEAQLKQNHAKLDELDKDLEEPAERRLPEWFPKRKLPQAPAAFTGKKAVKEAASPKKAGEENDEEEYQNEVDDDTVEVEVATVPSFTLVWRHPKLPHSYVETPKTANSNVKGNFGLSQANYKVEGEFIDSQTYFRQQVFGKLSWSAERTSPLVELATAQFYVTILGEDLGVFTLEVRHKPSGEAGQKNYPGYVSWGPIAKTIQEKELVGYSLNLYRLDGSDDTFKIEIQ